MFNVSFKYCLLLLTVIALLFSFIVSFTESSSSSNNLTWTDIPRTFFDNSDTNAVVGFNFTSREEVTVTSTEQTILPIEPGATSAEYNEKVLQIDPKLGPKESVFSPDDRSLISFPSTINSPWSSICKLYVTFPDAAEFEGSGSIIGPGQDGHGYHVLTAGHCVYDDDHGGWATYIQVIPGYDGAQTEVYKQKPYYHAYVTGARTYTAWTQYADHKHDFAVCTLDRNIGDFTGWMDIATYPSSNSIYTGVLNTAGYPGDIDEGLRMYFDSDNGRVADEFNHWYYMDTAAGQSGSPIWYLNASTGESEILSVHAYGDDGSGSNHGTRINQEKYDDINTWLSTDTPPVDKPDLCDDGEGWSGFSPTTVTPGETAFTVYCDVRNFGTSSANNFSVAYYASTDEVITNSDYLIGTFLEDSLPPLTYGDSSWNGVFPESIPPGNYCVGWIIDYENSVSEFDESNNVAYKTSYQLEVSIPDVNAPVTVDNYDGSWHTTSFTITLTATDDLSGVAETYYSINDGSWKTVSSDGQPFITTEGAYNKLEYYSVDNANNTEVTNILTGIKMDKTPPTGSILINGGDATTSSTSVTLDLTYSDAASGVDQVRYSNDGTWDTELWESPVATKVWPLTGGDGTKTVYYQVKNAAELVSSTYSDTIVLDTSAPAGSIVIDGDAADTTSTLVTLTLSASDAESGVVEMRFSNDGSSWSGWVGYGTSSSWTLSSGDGLKTVYVQFRNGAGLTSQYSDTITLDATPPPTPTPAPTSAPTATPKPTAAPTPAPTPSTSPSPAPTAPPYNPTPEPRPAEEPPWLLIGVGAAIAAAAVGLAVFLLTKK